MLGPTCNLLLHSDTDQPSKSMISKESAFQRSLKWNLHCFNWWHGSFHLLRPRQANAKKSLRVLSPQTADPAAFQVIIQEAAEKLSSSHSPDSSYHMPGLSEGQNQGSKNLSPEELFHLYQPSGPSQNHNWPLILMWGKSSLETMCYLPRVTLPMRVHVRRRNDHLTPTIWFSFFTLLPSLNWTR